MRHNGTAIKHIDAATYDLARQVFFSKLLAIFPESKQELHPPKMRQIALKIVKIYG